MATHTLNTRIQLKYDSLTNWETKNPALLQGELAIVTIETADPANKQHPPVMFKVGPGNFNDLDWASALAADVYAWAKAASLPIDTAKIADGKYVTGLEWKNNKLYVTTGDLITDIANNGTSTKAPTAKAVKDYVDAKVQDAVTGGTAGLATETYVNTQIGNLSKEGGAIKAVVDDLAAHEEEFETFQTNNTKAIADAKSGAEQTAANALAAARTEISTEIDADVKVVADDLADYKIAIGGTVSGLNSAVTDLQNTRLTEAQVKAVKVDNATNADSANKVANKLTIGSKTYDGSAAVEITAADLGLSGAMHFIGSETTLPASGNDGDVVLVSGKEYVWANSQWNELGDEGSHALKSITITGTDGLTGGGSLEANRTIGIADNGVTTIKIADKAVTKDKLADAVQTSLDKADSSVQSVALASGTNNGTVKLTVNGTATDNIAVTGLGSAAYTDSGAYATAAQGTKADTAVQNGSSNSERLTLTKDENNNLVIDITQAFANELSSKVAAWDFSTGGTIGTFKVEDTEIVVNGVQDLASRTFALETGYTNLAQIAKTGNVNDLVQTAGDYLILNCGTASTVI